MFEPDPFLQTSVLRRLQTGHGDPANQLVRPHARERIALAWSERAVIKTGPHTFRVTVPITGPLPGQSAVAHIVEAAREICADAPARTGCKIVSVHGHARPMAGRRCCLVLYVSCTGSGEDCQRDAAQVAGLIRNAARRCR